MGKKTVGLNKSGLEKLPNNKLFNPSILVLAFCL
jgi:hypothetical protein